MSTPVTAARVTVQRAASVPSPISTSTRLSRHTSDASDVSSTTPVTPAANLHHPRRARQRHPDHDSSSCSSTEALDQQSDDAWKSNPLYADQRRQRHRRTPHITEVDTQPLDDVLVDTTGRQHHITRSSFELHQPPVPLQSSTSRTSTSRTSTASSYKSEPDLSAADGKVIVQDSDLDACHSSMIDCISVAAPDDTVIKPSQLRESMRRRRTPSSTDDSAISTSMQRKKVLRGGSLRETKQTPAVECEEGSVRKRVAVMDVFSSPPSSRNSEPHSVHSGPVVSTSSSSTAGHFTFSVPHKRTSDAPEFPALPSFPRNPAHGAPSAKAGHEANGVGNLSYDQLLYKFKEVWYSFIILSCIFIALLQQSLCNQSMDRLTKICLAPPTRHG